MAKTAKERRLEREKREREHQEAEESKKKQLLKEIDRYVNTLFVVLDW